MRTDQPKAVRKGEELDIQSLRGFLQSELGLGGEIELMQFPSGFSNLTYFVKIETNEYVLRRAPYGANIKSGHDMSREYRFLSALKKEFSKIPAPVCYCEDASIIGAPFYLMERVRGVILRGHTAVEERPDAELMRSIAHSTIATMADLHKIDIQGSGLDQMGKADGYAQRQVEGWIRRYANAQTDDIPTMNEVGSWLQTHVPATHEATLVHNDFKYDNLVLAEDDLSQVIAVLDWEMATIGDPLMDLGTSLGYWLESSDPDEMKALNLSPTHWPGNPNREEVAAMYAKARGIDLDNLVFYYAYGVYKIAVIVQQIYFRYKKGHTKDPRFASLIHAVRAFSQLATLAINKDKISDLRS